MDESTEYQKSVIGCLAIPLNKVPDLEKKFAELRIKYKVFGEIKWENLNRQYTDKYKYFIDLIEDKEITFHATCFKKGTSQYKMAYSLLRTISWKLYNTGIKRSLYILFDNNGGLGKKETKIINDYAIKDKKFHHKISFCNQGKSHVMGTLQLTDILTGATAAVVNNNESKLADYKQDFIDYLTKKNNNIPLNYTPGHLPNLYEYKINLFDPTEKDISN